MATALASGASSLAGCYDVTLRQDLPRDVVWLHEIEGPLTTISVGPFWDARVVAELPQSFGLFVSPDGRWAVAHGLTASLVGLDEGTVTSIVESVGAGDSCDVPARPAFLQFSLGFRSDSQALLYGCQQFADADRPLSGRGFVLELDSLAGRQVEGENLEVRYTPADEILLREFAYPDRAEISRRVEVEDGSFVELPLDAYPFSRDRYLYVDSEGALRLVTPAGERVVVPDVGRAPVEVRTSVDRAVVVTRDLRRIEVAATGEVLREMPFPCEGFGVAREGGVELVLCSTGRTFVLDTVAETARPLEALDGVTWVHGGFDSRSSWTLLRSSGPRPVSGLFFVDTETLEVVEVPLRDPRRGRVVDAVLRYSARTF